MTRNPSKTTALKNIQPPVQVNLAAFKKELLKSEAKNARLEAENFRLKARVKALESERKLLESPSKIDPLDAARRIAFLLASADMHNVDSDGKS